MSFNFLKKSAITNRYPTDILVGELFVKAGIISQKQLDDTIKNSATKHLHVGQMLTMAGFINHKDLQAAVDAQSMMRDKLIDMAIAARCLKIAVKTGANFAELVKEELAVGQQASTQTNRLGELLLDAGIINKSQFGQAMGRSLATGLPLGRILVLNNSIPDVLLRLALELQVRIRDGMLERMEALDSLREEAIKSAVEAPSEDPDAVTASLAPIQRKKIRIGELFVRANMITDTDVMSCLELGLTSDRPIGEIMVEQGYVSPEMLNIALTVQDVVEEGRYTPDEAADSLKHMQATGRIIPEIQQRMDGTYVAPASTDNPGFSVSEPASPSPKASSSKLKPLYDGPELHGDFTGKVTPDLEDVANAPPADDVAPSLATLMRNVTGDSGFDEPAMAAAAANSERSLEDLLASAEASANQRAGQSGAASAAQNVAESNVALGAAFARVSQHGLEAITPPELTAVPEEVETSAHAPEPERELKRDSAPAAQVVSAASERTRALGAFESLLLSANVVNDADIQRAFVLVRETPEMFVDILKLTGLLTDTGRANVLECYRLQKEGDLTAEQASQVLDYCINQGRLRDLSLEGAMIELGWSRSVEEVQERQDRQASEQAQLDKEGQAEEEVEKTVETPQVEQEVAASALDLSDITASAQELSHVQLAAMDKAVVEEGEGDLLKMFGLSDQMAKTASVADSLMASLMTGPSEAAEKAETEAAQENPSAFETTAVFKQVSEEEVEEATSRAFDDSPSLEGLLSAFAPQDADEDEHDIKDEPVVASISEMLTAVEPAPELPLASGTAPAPEPEAEPDMDLSGLDQLLHVETAPEAEPVRVEPPAPSEDVDLRSLFTSGTFKAEPAKPIEPEVKPIQAPEPAPEPVPAPAPVPVPEPAPAAEPAPAPAPVPEPAPAAEPAPAPAPVPEPAPAPAPAPEPAPAPAPAKPAASASGTRLPKMNEADMNAAKAAQIAAMSSALTGMAEMFYEQENYVEAQRAYERILSWRQSELGPSHADVVDDLNNLAGVMCVQGNFAEAEPLIRRAVEILEKFEEPEPLKLAENLTSLAGLQFQQGVFDQAEPFLRQALQLREETLGPDNPELADSLRDFAKLLKKLGKVEEAEKHYQRAKVLLGKA